MIVCNRCGKENQNHYKFCLGCGAELSAPTAEEVGIMKTMMSDASGALPSMPARGAVPGPTGPGLNGPGPSGAIPAPGAMPAPGGAMPRANPSGTPSAAGVGMPRPAGPAAFPNPGPAFAGPPSIASPLASSGGGALGGPNRTDSRVSQGWGAPAMPPGPNPGQIGNAPRSPLSSPSAGFGGQPMTATRVCTKCGTEIPPNFKFCGACGTPYVAPPVAAPVVAAPPQPRAILTLIQPDGSEGGTFNLRDGENKIGRSNAPIFETDGYLSPIHSSILVSETQAVITDLNSLNGVFVRMTQEEELVPGQILRMGQELLRFDTVNAPTVAPDGTEIMGSPNPGYWGKITVIIGNGVDGAAYPLLGDNITLGRERGDINFPEDGYVSGLHARIVTRGGKVFISDLGSSNGTFVKLTAPRTIYNDSFVLLGQQLFRINFR